MPREVAYLAKSREASRQAQSKDIQRPLYPDTYKPIPTP